MNTIIDCISKIASKRPLLFFLLCLLVIRLIVNKNTINSKSKPVCAKLTKKILTSLAARLHYHRPHKVTSITTRDLSFYIYFTEYALISFLHIHYFKNS